MPRKRDVWLDPNPDAAPPAALPDSRRHGRLKMEDLPCSLGEVVNISASGLRVRCEGTPPCYEGQRIVISIAGPEGPFRVAVRPVWIRKVGALRHEIGLAFEDLTETSRVNLIELVRASVSVLPSDGEAGR